MRQKSVCAQTPLPVLFRFLVDSLAPLGHRLAASGGITLVVMQIRFFFALELSGVAVHMGSCDMPDGERLEGTATTHPSQ